MSNKTRKEALDFLTSQAQKDGLYDVKGGELATFKNDVREDDVEKLAEESAEYLQSLLNAASINLYGQGHILDAAKKMYKSGYNKAKENTYTEEQVREAIGMAKDFRYDIDTNEIIQSLKQSK